MFVSSSFNSFYILLLLVLAFNGCTPMLEPGQDRDYNSAQRQELEVLEKTQSVLEQMDGIDAALYFTKEDFTFLVNSSFEAFKAHFTLLDSPDFSKVSLESIELDLSNHQVTSKIEFSFEVDALKGKVFGHLLAVHRLQAGTDAFLLNTNFNEIVLDRIEGVESVKENSLNREVIGAAVKSFMHILNVEITNMPLRIPVDMNILSNINGRDIASSPDYKLHSARAVNMQTKMEVYLPYISEEGVVFLGASKMLPVIKTVKTAPLSALRDDVSASIDLALSKNIGISLDTLQKYTSYYVARKYLSKQMNLSLKTMDLRVINKFFLKIAQEDRHLQKEIYYFNKESLPACEGVKKECSELLNLCAQQCERKFGIHRCDQCDTITNPFEHVRCMSKIEACKRKEELNTYECHKREDKCEADNSLILASCEKKNAEYIEICKEKREKLHFIDDQIAIAKLHLDFDVDSSYAVQRIHQMSVDRGLNTLNVIRDIHISADTRIGLGLSESHNNEINCSLGMDEDLLVHSMNDKLQETKELSLSTQRKEDGALLLKAVSQHNLVSSRLKNAPYDKLMKMKEFNLQCTYQGMAMRPVSGEHLLNQRDIPYGLNVVFGDVEFSFDEAFSFVISAVRLGDTIVLYPTMETDAVGFSRQAHFY